MQYGGTDEQLVFFNALLKEEFGQIRSYRWLGLEVGNAVSRKHATKMRASVPTKLCRISCINKEIVGSVHTLTSQVIRF
jgi:hypothetical protein